ncbi:hypothetical protein NQ176_g7339 [Zarea fungicola]|uniref:Uncharacterized protein n=1 Tax=Zarea fungicola TaxID=93591 RepID=A0ACC1MYQ0_9HYPO|nr:hypothetical protein NQ176_g7339 [Lecanicillium fungicola]
MNFPAYIIASLSARPAAPTRTLDDRHQHTRPYLLPHHRGHSRQAPLSSPILTLERSLSTSKTVETDQTRRRRQSLVPYPHASAASPSYSSRNSLHIYPASSLHPVLAAAASPHWPRRHHDPLVTTGLNHSIASARFTMPPGDRPRQQPSVIRAAARAPLTPKIAHKAPPILASLARRPQGPAPTIANAQREDAASPSAAFLATNVTPRTGHRQTRVDSTNSTPSGTPNQDGRLDAWDRDSPRPSGLGITTSPESSIRQPEISVDSSDSNKFFYASDAKNIQAPAPQRQQQPPTQKGPTFFYATAPPSNAIDRSATSTPQSAPLLSPSNLNAQDPLSTKFFYANGTPDLEPKNTSATCQPATSGILCYGSGSSSTPHLTPQEQHRPYPSPEPHYQISCVAAFTKPSSDESTFGSIASYRNPPYDETSEHRRATETSQTSVSGWGKSSAGITDGSQTDDIAQPFRERVRITTQEMQGSDVEDDSFAEPLSPTKSHFSDSVSELVANARRERKVQDLEITNASLEAINRTLERQLRKQTAELRRYRRLSRSGRLSLSSIPNSRVVSEALTDPPVDLSDLSETEETEEDEDDFDDSIEESDISMTDTASMSAISMGAVRRKRDEKRLQLDLAKHQELLIDSQKMNQSIKRCLNWSEALIKEGQKALEYHVRVSDVEYVGGRVLAPADDEDDDITFQHTEDHGMVVKHDQSTSIVRTSPDRDSGIELPPGDDGS